MKKAPAKDIPKKSVLLVDDHPLLRCGLSEIINQQNDVRVCCEADNSAEALDRLSSMKPDLVVVDISLKGTSGLGLIKEMQVLHPDVMILVMSMHDELLYAERVLRAGARGYIMKSAGGKAVIEAVRQVLSGKIYVSERMSAEVLGNLAGVGSQRQPSPIEGLTAREFEIFELIGAGCRTCEVAKRLHISPKTVEVHRQNLKQKFRMATSAGLIQHAVRWVETREIA